MFVMRTAVYLLSSETISLCSVVRSDYLKASGGNSFW